MVRVRVRVGVYISIGMKNLKHFRVGDAKNGKRYIRKTWVGVGQRRTRLFGAQMSA